MADGRTTRRAFLRGAAAAAAVAAAGPRALRAQPRTVKVGMPSPVSGPMADVGQDSRLGAQLAVEAVNGAGGIKSMGGARIELLLADSRDEGRRRAIGGRPPHQRRRPAPDGRVPLGARGHDRAARAAAPRSLHRRHLGGGRAHRQRRQVGARGSAEDPVRLPDLPGQRDLRAERGPLHDGHLPRGRRESEARRADVLERPVRQDADGQLPGRPQGRQSRASRSSTSFPTPRTRWTCRPRCRGPARPSPTSSRP